MLFGKMADYAPFNRMVPMTEEPESMSLTAAQYNARVFSDFMSGRLPLKAFKVNPGLYELDFSEQHDS